MIRLMGVFLILISATAANASLLGDARAEYSRGDFEAFFGLAQWTRLAPASAQANSADRDQLLALEMMALARHCRWADIAVLKEEVQGPYAIKAFELIAVKEEYVRFQKDPKFKALSLSRKIEHSREHWAISPDKMRSFARPDALRVKVRSQCASS